MILLDTHVVVWVSGFPDRLSPAAVNAIGTARSSGEKIAISCISLYEVAWGVMRGRIEISDPLPDYFEQLESKFLVQPLTGPIAIAAADFPASLSGDPFDRIIAATALTEGIPLVTADERIRRSGVVNTIW
jgi:PIN domain nuclease of toxin-antitoxin system